MQDNFFGQPAAFNRWFGDDLIIPPATGLLLPNYPQAPAPPPIPGSQPGRNLPPTGQGDPGADQGFGYDTQNAATYGPAGNYATTGYDPNPTAAKAVQAVTAAFNPFSAFTQGLVDKSYESPLEAAYNDVTGKAEADRATAMSLDVSPQAAQNQQTAAANAQRDTAVGNRASGIGVGRGTAAPGMDRPGSEFDGPLGISISPMSSNAIGSMGTDRAAAPIAGPFGTTRAHSQAEIDAAQAANYGYDYDVDTGAAGPGASSESVLCTALYHQGLLPECVYRADEAFGDHLEKTDPDVVRGYQLWARPIARLMELNRTFAAGMSVLVLPWAHEIYGNPNWLGRFYLRFGVPLCRFMGRRKDRRESVGSVGGRPCSARLGVLSGAARSSHAI